MHYTYTPHMVCSTKIDFDIVDGKIHDVRFTGGCHGNLQAIAKLVEGQDAGKIIGILKGNDCRGRGTSCADQFALALENALHNR